MVEYTHHAERRMVRRGISKADVEFCLENHHISLEEKEGCMLFIANHPNGKRIQVVLDTTVTPNKVVTAIWLD